MRKDYDIVGSYDNQRVSTISAERTVNMFEYIDPNGKRPKSLLSTSGLVDTELNFLNETLGSRATFVYQNKLTGVPEIYQVFGNSVFRITGSTGSLSATRIGLLTTPSATGYVGIDANTYQIIFVDGQGGWIWDIATTTFTKITDSSFPAKPIDVCFLDGFFIVANGDTNSFQLSMINQGLVWGPSTATFTVDSTPGNNWIVVPSTANFQTGVPFQLSTSGGGVLPVVVPPLTTSDIYYAIRVDATNIRIATTYANAIAGIAVTLTTNGAPTLTVTGTGQLQQAFITTHPGTIVACRTLHRRLFLFSQNFTEIWENSGLGSNLPFRRNNSLLMEVGTPAIGSVVVGFDRMFFLSQDKDGLGAVMEVKGTESIPVSNRALDFQLAQYAADQLTGVADARGILIKENGLIFYRLNFTLANHTFVLNVTMSTIEAQKWHEEEVLDGNRHPGQTHAYFDGVNYYGSYSETKFYSVDDEVSTNDGEAIRRMRIGRQMTPEGYNRLRIDRFHLDLLQGKVEEQIFDESFLLAETGDDLLTENSEQLLLDQQALLYGSNPVVFLSISRDGGQSYGYVTRSPMGKIGQRTFRTVWRKLGTTPRGQGFTPKIEFYNEVPFIILGAAWDFDVLPE